MLAVALHGAMTHHAIIEFDFHPADPCDHESSDSLEICCVIIDGQKHKVDLETEKFFRQAFNRCRTELTNRRGAGSVK